MAMKGMDVEAGRQTATADHARAPPSSSSSPAA